MMKVAAKRTGIVALLALVAGSAAAQQKRGLQPQDYYRMTFVEQPSVSPRGDYVAFTVTTVVEAENRRHREIWLQALRDGQPAGEPFRFTDAAAESSSPAWSPDGTMLALNSRRGREEGSIRFLRVTAPGGEAFRVDGVDGAPVWSPDGRWIAYLDAPEPEVPDSLGPKERRGWIAPDAISRTLDARRFDGRVITQRNYRRDGTLAFLPHPATVGEDQLYVVAAAGGTPRQLTRTPWSVRDPVWSPDGRLLFFGGDEAEMEEYNDEATQDLFVVPVEGGQPRKLTTNPGSESAPAVSPDGRRLAFLSSAGNTAQTEVMVVEIGPDGSFQGSPRNLTASWDLDPGDPLWTPDGRAIRFSAGIGGNQHLFEVAAAGGQVRQVTTGDRQLGAFSFTDDARVMVYSATDPQHPAELFVARGDGSREARLTRFNDAWLAEVQLMPAERLTWRVADGTEIEGWVVKPLNYQPGRKYPMVLKIHGGPHGAYGNTFFDTFQILSGAGFFVLYPNPRGSTGYGQAFMNANKMKWGLLDEEDFLKGVDAALAKYPDVDPNRIGVSGGSYGGYATNWLTAHTNRFAAAVTSRSIADLRNLWGTSDGPGGLERDFGGGAPWEFPAEYAAASPVTYVHQVTAPTLIIQQENDWRTPMQDAEIWFASLKKLGVPVEFVRYPRSSHGLSRSGEPWLLVDRLERIRSWFTYWLIENPDKLPARRATNMQQ